MNEQPPEPEMTKDDLRARLKAAFFAGFAAARRGSVEHAWEESDVRRLHDYGPIREPHHG